MKKIVMLIGFLALTTGVQAANPNAPVACSSPADVQKALNAISLDDVKNQIGRKLNVPTAGAQRKHLFNFENQPINRVSLVGNRCQYFTPGNSSPIYTIILQ